MKVFVVESDSQIVADLYRQLIEWGHTVHSVQSIEQARKHLEEYRIDCLIIGVTLPDGYGLDFVKELKEKTMRPLLF